MSVVGPSKYRVRVKNKVANYTTNYELNILCFEATRGNILKIYVFMKVRKRCSTRFLNKFNFNS